MVSIMINANEVKSIIGEPINDAGTYIELINGHVIYICPEWSLIFKELDSGPVLLIEL